MMTLSEIAKGLELTNCGQIIDLDREVTGGVVCDLLSVVMSKACKGDLWVTIQCHPNIVAVALMANLCGIVIAHGFDPEAETLERAGQEAVPVFTTPLSSFEIAGRLYPLINENGKHGASVF